MTLSIEMPSDFSPSDLDWMNSIFDDPSIPEQASYPSPEPASEEPNNRDNSQISPAIVNNAFFQRSDLAPYPYHFYERDFQFPESVSIPAAPSSSINSHSSVTPVSKTRKRKTLQKVGRLNPCNPGTSLKRLKATQEVNNTPAQKESVVRPHDSSAQNIQEIFSSKGKTWKKWTEQERQTLLQMRREGFLFKNIGEKIGKTDRCVRNYFRRLPEAIKIANDKPKIWGQEQFEYFVQSVAKTQETWDTKAGMMNERFEKLNLHYTKFACCNKWNRHLRKQEKLTQNTPPA